MKILKSEKTKKNISLKSELYIKLLIFIILVLLVIITSFNTGRKFYILKNTYLENSKGEINSGVARWNFSARVITGSEVQKDE